MAIKSLVPGVGSAAGSRRDIRTGPLRIRVVSYGVSLAIPRHWLAGLTQGELFGLQPVASDHNCRIYVQRVDFSSVELMRKANTLLLLDGLSLSPGSEFLSTGTMASVHMQVFPARPYNRAFACWTPIARKATLVGVLLGKSRLALADKTALQGIIASVRVL